MTRCSQPSQTNLRIRRQALALVAADLAAQLVLTQGTGRGHRRVMESRRRCFLEKLRSLRWLQVPRAPAKPRSSLRLLRGAPVDRASSPRSTRAAARNLTPVPRKFFCPRGERVLNTDDEARAAAVDQWAERSAG
jgi:hypothetical protein